MYHLTFTSGNVKTGAMPVSMSSNSTCPNACPLKEKGCYAKQGPILWHWRKLTSEEKGLSLDSFLAKVRTIPQDQLWRHNQAGDLPGGGDDLDIKSLGKLVAANTGKRGFTYTHKPLRKKKEREAVKEANEKGFAVNLSGNNLAHADKLKKLGIAPVVVIVASFQEMPKRTPGGNKLVPCPEQTHGLTCNQCKLCYVAKRQSIVAFEAHGRAKYYVADLARKEEYV